MLTIALIGGNSQVATEVALFLRISPGVAVIPVCRSLAGSAFLRHCGFSCRVGDIGDPEVATRLLRDVDLAVDFSRPEGSAGEIRRRMTATITNLVKYSPQGCRLAYTSTEMAFGMRMTDNDLRYRRFARTTYGVTKRYAEKLIHRLARQERKEAWVLRLGQVHGELQGVSAKMRMLFLENRPVAMPDTRSDTVFAYSVAESLLHIAEGREEPGTYTLMSTPDWHWKDIYRYYSQECGATPPLVLYPSALNPVFRRSVRAVQTAGKALLFRYREMIGAYILSRIPRVEQSILARYRLRNSEREISEINAAELVIHGRPVVGPIPGARLTSLSDSRITMELPAKQVREILAQASKKLTCSQPSIKETSHSSPLPS